MHVPGIHRDVLFQGYKTRRGATVSIAKNKIFYPGEDGIHDEFMISGSTFFPDHELEDIPSVTV